MTPKQPTPDLLTSQEAAKMLGLSVRTLANWRSRGLHLPYKQYGKKGSQCRYERKVIESFLQSRTVLPVGERAA